MEKFRVSKEIEGGNVEQDFQFTLYLSDVRKYNIKDVFNYYGSDPDSMPEETHNFVVMSNEPYDVYDTASGALVGSKQTDINGKFTLKGGQYAEFTGYRYGKDDAPDSFWTYNPDANDIIYKVIETPYANYVPQVKIVHVTTERGQWHSGYYDDDIISENVTTAQANGGSIQAGGSIAFCNAFGESSGLVVTKQVTARDGVTAPVNDEFTFTLKVDGKVSLCR